jgi:hypothetical protein
LLALYTDIEVRKKARQVIEPLSRSGMDTPAFEAPSVADEPLGAHEIDSATATCFAVGFGSRSTAEPKDSARNTRCWRSLTISVAPCSFGSTKRQEIPGLSRLRRELIRALAVRTPRDLMC